MDTMGTSEAVSAPESAYQWLRKTIAALPWDQELFLSEMQVAEASGISRTPVREALLRLEAAGHLRRAPRRGAYVPALSKDDIDSMMEVRSVIEDWAVRKVTEEGMDFDFLDRLLDDQEKSVEDPVSFIEHDVAFHRAIVESAGNKVLSEVYESQRFKQLRLGVKAVVDTAGRSDHVLNEHKALAAALRSGDPDQAAEALEEHLTSTQSSLRRRRTMG